MWALMPILSGVRIADIRMYLIDTNVISEIRKKGRANPGVFFLTKPVLIIRVIFHQ